MPENWSDWIAFIGSIGILVGGGGGIIAWFRLRDDSKKGVRQENRSDSDSLNAQAVALVETQFNYFIKPLRDELEQVKRTVTELEAQIKTHKDKYAIAIAHIITLYAWIKVHITGTDETPPPPPPALAEDV